MVFGTVGRVARSGRGVPGSPRTVLEALLVEALQHTPCVVAFSGGRDSSALLALALAVARSHGLQAPVAVTRRYPGDAAADESAWQERVVRHLGVTDWVRLPLDGTCDLIGPLATRVLRRHGPVWPPTVHALVPVLEVARGGAVVTGEGGDEVFGARRVAAVRHLAGGRRRRHTALRALPYAVGLPSTRRWLLRRSAPVHRWLTAAAQHEVTRRRVAEQVSEPLSWRRSVRLLGARRAWTHGAATMQLLADDYAVTLHHPLLDPVFLDAHAASGSVVGPLTRSEAMRRLFADLLPDDVVRRRSKATFNTTLFGRHSRAFAADWSGAGVDPDLIDADGLAAAWAGHVPDGRTYALLQHIWLHAAATEPETAR